MSAHNFVPIPVDVETVSSVTENFLSAGGTGQGITNISRLHLLANRNVRNVQNFKAIHPALVETKKKGWNDILSDPHRAWLLV